MLVCKLRFIRKQHTKNESRLRKLKFERMIVNSKYFFLRKFALPSSQFNPLWEMKA